MTVLTDLPPELLEGVFHYLGSIDDVHHFARACKTTLHVIQRKTVYVEIMRSIISQAPQHRFDIQLCKMLDLHSDIVHHFRQGGGPIPPTQPSSHVLNQAESALCSAFAPGNCQSGPCNTCMPDNRIYEILARYQGLQLLQSLWLARELKDKDFLATDFSADEDAVVERFDLVRERQHDFQEHDANIPARRSQSTTGYTSLSTAQKARFYAAVVGVWLFNEIRWVLTNFTYPTANFSVQVTCLDECTKQIHAQTQIPLLDQLDRYSVFQFMYHHLLPLHATFLADRDSSKLPLTFPSELEKNTVHCTRFLQLFLSAGQTYLQPPDIIELVIRSTLSCRRPYPAIPLPVTTELWLRPLNVFRFPSNADYGSEQHVLPNLILRNAYTHLDLIKRSTVNQYPLRQVIMPRPTGNELFRVPDTHDDYFCDRALVEFEKYEKRVSKGDKDQELFDIRKIWSKNWPKIRWQVWWWAESEEKARSKMERWRVPKGPARPQRA